MIVQVDSKQINIMEQRIEELSAMLTAVVAKRSKGVHRISTSDLESVVNGSLSIVRDDSGITLSYTKPES